MKKIICDKCGKEINKEIKYLFECFNGSLTISDFDLCENCWDNLQEIINKFTKDKK